MVTLPGGRYLVCISASFTQVQVEGSIAHSTRTRNARNEFMYTLHSGGMLKVTIWHPSCRYAGSCTANQSCPLDSRIDELQNIDVSEPVDSCAVTFRQGQSSTSLFMTLSPEHNSRESSVGCILGYIIPGLHRYHTRGGHT